MFVLLMATSIAASAQNDNNWSGDFNLSEHGPFFLMNLLGF
jgi:hypothetical protein